MKPDSRQWKQAHLTLLVASLEAETQQIEQFVSSVQQARERAEALFDRASALADTTTQATAVLLTVTRSAAQLLAEEALADADDGGERWDALDECDEHDQFYRGERRADLGGDCGERHGRHDADVYGRELYR